MWWTLRCWKNALRQSKISRNQAANVPLYCLVFFKWLWLLPKLTRHSGPCHAGCVANTWSHVLAPEDVLNQLLCGSIRPFKMHDGGIIPWAGQGWILSFFFIGMSFYFSGIFRSLNFHQGPLSSIIHFNDIFVQRVVTWTLTKDSHEITISVLYDEPPLGHMCKVTAWHRTTTIVQSIR